MERLAYLFAVFWIFPASVTFGQNVISFTSPSGQTLPGVPYLVASNAGFAPAAPVNRFVVLPGNPAPVVGTQQQPITVRTWDSQGGSIVSWDARLDATQFNPGPPPISFPYPFFSVPNLETMMHLSGQPDGTSVNAVPEPGAILVLALAGSALVVVGRARGQNQRAAR